MKKRVLIKSEYIANLRIVTFLLPFEVKLENIFLITNVTTGLILYNFAKAGFTGTIQNNVLSLSGDGSVRPTDELLIVLQLPSELVKQEDLVYLQEINESMKELVVQMKINNRYMGDLTNTYYNEKNI